MESEFTKSIETSTLNTIFATDVCLMYCQQNYCEYVIHRLALV